MFAAKRSNRVVLSAGKALASATYDITIVAEGGRWAVKHGSGYLGFVASFPEALALREVLESPGRNT